jgi:hypothetical protein
MDPPALSRRLQVKKNTLRDRCSHISGLLVKTSYSLRALMKSALPPLITTAASRALYLIRVKGSRSDLSCHQLEPTSHRAAGLLHCLIEHNNHEKVWHLFFCRTFRTSLDPIDSFLVIFRPMYPIIKGLNKFNSLCE